MYVTVNNTAMNSTEKINPAFGDFWNYDFLDENWKNNPYWLLFICALMWVVYPFAYGVLLYNVWKWIGGEEYLDEGYEDDEADDDSSEDDEIDEEEF